LLHVNKLEGGESRFRGVPKNDKARLKRALQFGWGTRIRT
jgi:hypothetical protein